MTQTDAAQPYIRRHLQEELETALADTPVVCLFGPRQCGKSTLAMHLNPQRTYFSHGSTNASVSVNSWNPSFCNNS